MTQPASQQGDEWVLDVPPLRRFIEAVNELRYQLPEPHQVVAAIRPHFTALLNDKTWLPAHYQEPAE